MHVVTMSWELRSLALIQIFIWYRFALPWRTSVSRSCIEGVQWMNYLSFYISERALISPLLKDILSVFRILGWLFLSSFNTLKMFTAFFWVFVVVVCFKQEVCCHYICHYICTSVCNVYFMSINITYFLFTLTLGNLLMCFPVVFFVCLNVCVCMHTHAHLRFL